MEEKGFQALTGLLILLLVIATIINVMYLGIFIMGTFATLMFSFWAWSGESFAGMIVLCSLVMVSLAVIVWLLTSIIVGPIPIEAGITGVGGAVFPGIMASAYLESVGPY